MPEQRTSQQIGDLKQTKRYGCIAARIGSDHQHRVSVDLDYAQMGTLITAKVEDGTRHPHEFHNCRWICRSPMCAGKSWPTKAELLAAHPDQRQLIAREETHLYMGVFEQAFQAAEKGKMDKVTGEKTPDKPEIRATFMLLSDEE